MYGCLARGLSFKIGQGNVITLSPPLVIAEADLDRAFDILTWRSQMTHVKVKTVAGQFLEAVMREGLSPESVSTIDRLLLPTDKVTT